ncbi:Transcriptional regulator, AbiEi antitoxin, Type IV TA system [Desulfuromusa kysingii]|uniref:Transcriptional regulator, AbiEi antitoxin, Type IV TA system n=1 Tax=Desulfuromusa kysingii TaxID=37625 RepID=A0A1H3VYG4_9BACT|nr:type IV toxin-antitoxin system AbiEi family antitoxin [Desulfuromusa kysingii]SDZ79780.1 Transcriptional regulator, AbiEi antitoxin, Type IV TA system [Desulfuromusa kysingii]
MPRKPILQDEQIIYNSMKAIRTIPQTKIEFMLQKVGGPFAGTFRLSGAWGNKYYYLKVIPKLTPTLTDLVIHQIKTSPAPDHSSPLLVSHYISPQMAALLKQQGIEYADGAGNLYLNQMPLYIEIGGQKHPKKPAGADRIFRTTGLKLIYLLLRNPQAINATYRTLADDAGIALGAIGDLFSELEKRGNLSVDDKGKRILNAGEELLQRWQLGYLETLRPKLFLQRCQLPAGYDINQIVEQLQQMAIGKEVLIGGELGAAILSSKFQPQSAVLYIQAEQLLKLMLQLHLTPDPDGQITLLQPFGNQCHWGGWQPDGITLADPLLTFAELCGSATDQVADKLYHQYLTPRLGY